MRRSLGSVLQTFLSSVLTRSAIYGVAIYGVAVIASISLNGQVYSTAQKKLAAPPVSLKSRLLAMLNRICDHRMGGEQPSALFLQAVDEKVFITYRQFVKRPMDLGSIRVSRLVLF